MSSSITAYTPLETLLLFQALRADAAQSISFSQISDQLKSIPLIRDDTSYDSGRLSPDALRTLYLDLLKEEIKEDLEQNPHSNSHLPNGDVSPGSRKRKAASPSLPSVREAAQHSHLIPKLVTRLYARYRDHLLKRLQTHQLEYESLKQDISEIEAGQWDERLQQRAISQTHTPNPSSTAHTRPTLPGHDNVQPSTVAVTAAASPSQTAESGTQEPLTTRYSQAKTDAVISHGSNTPDVSVAHRRASSSTAFPPLSEVAPQSPRFGVPPKIPSHAAPPPIQPLPTAPNHSGYAPSPPTAHHSPYAPQHTHPRTGSIPGPQMQQSVSRPSSSPRPILPPPQGMPVPSGPQLGSPVFHPPPLLHQQQQPPSPQHYQQQSRRPSGPSPTTEGPLRGYPATPVASHHPAYYSQQQPYGDRRTSYPQPQPTYPNSNAGYMLPPFQVQAQDFGNQMPQHRPPQPLPAQSHRPFMPQTLNMPATAPRNPLPMPTQNMSRIIAALATPTRVKRPLWKTEFRPSPHVQSALKPRPEIEPLSPTLERAKSPVRSNGSTRGRELPMVEQSKRTETASKTRASRRRGNVRDRSPHSVVSSTADGSLRARTRSQSVSTVTGVNAMSDDRPGSRGAVKLEPSTPAEMLDETESITVTAATPASGMMTRKRRGTIQSQPQPLSKRKRQESPGTSTADDHELLSTPASRSNTVIATRNFSKMSSAIMNDIISHKHASYFANPVRDKDAPGYSEIVRQPQNLKSIRSAIAAGARAITSASSALESPIETHTTSSTTVQLERTADLIPPKAIVNGAQLEKELMRMFANAYMFNPGEDGMALSTKEMFEEVEEKLTEWRGTEREAGGDEDEDAKVKRRKA